MKKNIILLLIALITFIMPINARALSNSYSDRVANIVNVKREDNKVNLYLFHGDGCPHCRDERNWLEGIKREYKNKLNVYYFEVWYNADNVKLMDKVKEEFNVKESGVPLTIIGGKYFSGFNASTAVNMENKIKEYLTDDKEESGENKKNLPLLGDVDLKSVSIPLVATILGFIDGFNPCAMWILLFLINLLFGMKDKKKAWTLGLVFLFISGFVYFLSMIGINFVLGIATINWMKIVIAIFILIFGILNLRKYLKIRKEEAGCTVVDDKKRKNLISRMKKIVNNKSFMLSIIGVIVLGASVNLIEMACSLGFPLVFNEVLTVNNIVGVTRIIYLLIYIFFYMIDDIVVFAISMITLEATGITNKYNKLCTLISAIIMIIMGVLLILKPEWLMFNF